MKLDFYHWASMCPIHCEILSLLKEYEDRIEIHVHDITGNPLLAKQQNMYYPTLTVLEDRNRYYSPIGRAFLDQAAQGIFPKERPYRPSLGTVERSGEIVPLTKENYAVASCCTGRSHCTGAAEKAQFLEAQGLSVFGFLNLEHSELLGGAEYVPSSLVPYDIPRDGETAFLTCVYLSGSEYDYKSAPLRALEAHLTGQYKRILAISDEQSVFPNGDLAFFLRNGYTDLGIVAQEDGYCTLHMLEKKLT